VVVRSAGGIVRSPSVRRAESTRCVRFLTSLAALVLTATLAPLMAMTFASPAGAAAPQFTPSVATLPSDAAAQPSVTLTKISCPAPGACVAVGNYAQNGPPGPELPLVETLAAGQWSAGTLPLPSGSTSNTLLFMTGISCSQPDFCVAVGFDEPSDSSSAGQPLVETLTSSGWTASILPLPDDATGDVVSLSGVACTSAESCVVVGSYQTAGSTPPLVETLSAGGWAASAGVLPNGGSTNGVLSAVSCPLNDVCTAVGSYLTSSDATLAFSESISGDTLAATGLPIPPDAADGQPFAPSTQIYALGISCPTVGSCVAVGRYMDRGGAADALVETLSSTTWTYVPLASKQNVWLLGVSCQSVSACVAVGTYGVLPGDDRWETEAPIETLLSGTWSLSNAPLPSTVVQPSAPALSGVSCSGSSACVAVGDFASDFSTSNSQGLIEATPTLTVTNTSLAPGAIGESYSQALDATGGTAPYTWTIAPGDLPAGLHLSTEGSITGMPTVTGSKVVTVVVTDAAGLQGSATFSMSIYNFLSSTVASISPSQTTLGGSVMYSAQVTSGGGVPTGTVAFSIGSTTVCVTASLVSGAASCTSTNAPPGANTVRATYSGDANFAPSVGTTSLVILGGPYSPLTPVRICDSRPVSSFSPANQCNSGVGNPIGPIQAGTIRTINVANAGDEGLGTFGVPADATSVVLNVTAVNPAAGYMSVYPAGAALPNASNLNYPIGETVPNLVQVGIGSGGDVSFFASSQTDLLVDVEGYTATDAAGGLGAGLYNVLPTPARLCDTRPVSSFTAANQCDGPGNAAGTLAAGVPKDVQVTDPTIPHGATAAILNVTVVNPADAGYLTAYPQGTSEPNASNLNFGAGQTTTNRVIVPLSSSGQISLVSSVATDVIVDVSGYYTAVNGDGTQFTAEGAPVRVCDTRAPSSFSPQNQCSNQHVGSGTGQELTLKVTNGGAVSDGVPATATAVVVNLTGIDPTAATFLTVFPGPILPNSSDLNPAAGETRANLVVATVNPSTGKISVFNNTGSLDVLVDVLGWYSTSNPTVASIDPTGGPTFGGTSVTVTGTNLAGATAVSFGSTPGTITADSANSVTATTPAGEAGAVDVTVTTSSGTSRAARRRAAVV
jgi:hypothetical protein